MGSRRNTYRYTLRDRGKVVYYGITKDLERRESQHRDEGKRFTTMRREGSRVKRETAEKWEEERLARFRATHGGRTPRYNETDK